MLRENLIPRIEEFKKRTDKEFCEQLFKDTTVRLMAFKYAYYVMTVELVHDRLYEGLEESWFIMGYALGHLKEDEISPCVDFDYNHPMANEGIELFKMLRGNK